MRNQYVKMFKDYYFRTRIFAIVGEENDGSFSRYQNRQRSDFCVENDQVFSGRGRIRRLSSDEDAFKILPTHGKEANHTSFGECTKCGKPAAETLSLAASIQHLKQKFVQSTMKNDLAALWLLYNRRTWRV